MPSRMSGDDSPDGDDDAIDQDTGNLHRPRIERSLLRRCALDLRDDEPARVPRRHRHRQVIQRQRLPLHRDIAGEIGRGSPDERDLDRKRLVEQPLLPVDFDQPDEFLRRRIIDPAAVLAGIDERAQADLRGQARPVPGYLAKELGNAAERQIVGLDRVVEREFAQFRHQRPVPADRALDEAGMRKLVEAAVLAVARRRHKNQRQLRRLPRAQKPLLQREDKFVGRADADKPGDGDRVAVAYRSRSPPRPTQSCLSLNVPRRRPAILLACWPASPRSLVRAASAIVRRRTRRHGRPAGEARNSPDCRPYPRAPWTSRAERCDPPCA